MQIYIKTKNILILLLVFFACFSCSTSYAVYDVVKATTYSEKTIVNDVRMMEPEMYDGAEFEKIEPQEDLASIIERKFKKIFKKKNNDLDDEIESDIKAEEVVETQDDVDSIVSDNEFNLDNQTDNQEDVKNKFQINADKVTYNDEDGNVYANGNVEIISHAQGVKLVADNAVLDKDSQTLKLSDNVKIIKDNTEMRGESLLVDLNEQNILMDNPEFEAYSFLIKAQEGYLIANDIQMLNGTVKTTQKQEFPLGTRGFMRIEPTYKTPYIEKVSFEKDPSAKSQRYRIDSKEIVFTNYKDHRSFVLKGSNVYYNDKKIVRNADIEIITDKSNQVAEINAPEAGNLRGFGTYVGYGMLFKLPKGHTLKLMPVLTYKSGVGVGAIARYRNQHGLLEGGWNTSSENLVVRGKFQLSDNVNIMFGRNAYIPEGFMGANRSGYGAQLQYLKSYAIRDLDAYFSNGLYAGVFSDYDSGRDPEDTFSTTRFRYMAQLHKDIYLYKNPEQDFQMLFRATTQGAATVYGSGETQGIIRIGPQVVTRYKRWEQNLAYYLSGIHGESPFVFDEYRYGKSTIAINERFAVNDKFAFGFRVYLTPMKDNRKEDFLTECRFYVVVGPRDLKLALSYDFVRDVAHMDFMFLLGSDNSRINFDKLTTKDIDDKTERRDFYKYAKPVKIERSEDI